MESSAKKELKEMKIRVRQISGRLDAYAKMVNELCSDIERRMRQATDDFAEQERLRCRLDLLKNMGWEPGGSANQSQ